MTNDEMIIELHRIINDKKVKKFKWCEKFKKCKDLPENGLYIFLHKHNKYHSMNMIGRIGTHGVKKNSKPNNNRLKGRLDDHYNPGMTTVKGERILNKDGSIFRKLIGEIFIKQWGKTKDYLEKDINGEIVNLWKMSFRSKDNRKKYGNLRIPKLEEDATREAIDYLKNEFEFVIVRIDGLKGKDGEDDQTKYKFDPREKRSEIERQLIASVSKSEDFLKYVSNDPKVWLGADSLNEKVRENGLWLTQHLKDEESNLTQANLDFIKKNLVKEK